MTPEEHQQALLAYHLQRLEQARQAYAFHCRRMRWLVIRAVSAHMALFLFACWLLTRVTPHGWAWWVNIANALLNIGFAAKAITWLPKERGP